MSAADAFATRVQHVRELMSSRGYDGIIIRNNPDLRWLTGAQRTFDGELAHTAFITLDSLYLHTDSRYYNTFVEKLGENTPWQLDMDPISHTMWAAGRIKAIQGHVIAVEDSMQLGFYDGLKRACEDLSLAVGFPRMHNDISSRLRSVKDEEEIQLMRHAQKITDATFDHMVEFIKPGMTELEIRNELENYMFAHGADALSFETIIASGPNGANPHAQPSDRKVQPGDFIVMDYGAGYKDYHSDMTRTVCLGEPTEEMVKVYNVVRDAHEKAADAVRPGVTGASIHQIAADVIADAGYGQYFGHGLGHGVGVEIHEEPNFNLRNTNPIPAGAVITDEPGIYLPGKFGVRIEDFGVVGENGYEPFTQSTHELVCIPVA